MAAIDPTEEPELEAEPKTAPRATLKLVRVPGELFDDSDEEENSDDETELENGVESSDEEMGMKGGPSAPKKKDGVSGNKQAHEDDEDMSEDDAEAAATLQKIMKGKSKAINGEGPDSDLEDDDEALELEEVVICTLDPEKVNALPTYRSATDFYRRTVSSRSISLSLKMNVSSSRSPAHTLYI